MRLHRTTSSFIVGATLALVAAPALAQEGASEFGGGGNRFPVPYVERPLVMPHKMLGLAAMLGFEQMTLDLGPLGSESETMTMLSLGAMYGLIENLEVGLMLPVLLSPDADIGDPRLYGVYRLLDNGAFELGVLGALDIGLNGDTGLVVGAPIAYHFGTSMRLDSGLLFGIGFHDDPVGTIITPYIPLELHFQAMRPLSIGVVTGLWLPDFDADMMQIPLGVRAIYALGAGAMPMGDIGVAFSFPMFLMPGSEGDAIYTDLWALTASFTYYMDL
ncbi:hypothetical protein L6R52_31140 [Myxococcota bacterium]|nr:hypothetical protein [Myxococcota bacterium]